jgi:SAM-dependent methyltransferase
MDETPLREERNIGEGPVTGPRPRQSASLGRRLADMAHLEVLRLAGDGSRPRTILDIGCGPGRLLRQAKALYPDATLLGVDPEGASLRSASLLLPSGTFFLGTVEALPLPDDSVDLAVSTFSFHHWPQPAEGVRQVARVLRPGGRLLIADLWPPFGLWALARHFWPSGPSRVREMCRRGGLTVLGQERKMGRFVVVTICERPAAESVASCGAGRL